MLKSLAGAIQPPTGMGDHWQMFKLVRACPSLFDPLLARIVAEVENALAENPPKPVLDSRVIAGAALSALDSWWHGEFPRRFLNFPNGADRGIAGMVLWNYLATAPDVWVFQGIQDAHGAGQSATAYWRQHRRNHG